MDTCHTAVVTGDGHIPEYACLQCHNKREVLEAKYTPEQLHRNHVTDHKVECFTCHSAIKHEIRKLPHKDVQGGDCAQCHDKISHGDKQAMYAGKGARFVKDVPNLMARLNMDCTLCHKHDKDKLDAESKCKDCHGNITDGMVDRWKKITRAKMDGLSKEINEVKEISQKKDIGAESKKKLNDAIFNYNFLLNGNPIHNVIYSLEIVDKTQAVLGEIRAKATGTPAKPSKFAINCTDLCHGNVAEKKVSFGSVNFPHEIHADSPESCLKCHTPYTNHGNTVLKGCSECHHGKGEGKVSCKDCHSTEDTTLRSKGSLHGKLTCVQCHSSVKEGKKESVSSIKESCVRCHGKKYGAKVDEWMDSDKKLMSQSKANLAQVEKDIEEIEAKEGRHSVPLRKLFDEITEDTNSLVAGKYWHNPVYSDAVMERTKKNVQVLETMMKVKRQGKAIILR